MKDYKIEEFGCYSPLVVLVEQFNDAKGRIGFIYYEEWELPVDGFVNTVAFFRVKQRKRVSWWKRVFKRLRNIR